MVTIVEVDRLVKRTVADLQAPTPIVTIEFGFDTVDGSVLTAGGWVIVRLDFPCQIIGAHLYGDVASSSIISLALGTSADWPRNTPISSSSPFSLNGLTYNPLSVANWKISLQPADVLVARLMSVTNNVSHVLLAVDAVRMPWVARSIGTAGLTNLAGDRIVDSLGNPVVQRN